MEAEKFLQNYEPHISGLAEELRAILFKNLPDVTEQVDLPARMIAYVYGQKYIDTVCAIIPSKKEIKLGFYKGPELPDPDGLLKGNGKISRYIVIRSLEDLRHSGLKTLLREALKAYKLRMKSVKK